MPDSLFDSFYNNLIAEDRYRMILDGLQVTLLITFCAVFMGNTKEQVEHLCQWLADNIK